MKKLAWVTLPFLLVLAACGDAGELVAPADSWAPAARALLPVGPAVAGDGTIGDSLPDGNGGIHRLDFRLEAASDLSGFVHMTDYGVLRADGRPAELHVGPEVPGSAILTFLQLSAACVRFGGVAKLDTNETKEFLIEVCDNGSPGRGLDLFGISIPTRPYARGPDMLSDGEIVLTGGLL